MAPSGGRLLTLRALSRGVAGFVPQVRPSPCHVLVAIGICRWILEEPLHSQSQGVRPRRRRSRLPSSPPASLGILQSHLVGCGVLVVPSSRELWPLVSAQ
jgi:hypothetical protein